MNDMKPKILPPLLFPSKNHTERKFLGRLKREGKIRLVGSRLYCSVPKSQEREVIRAGWSLIVSSLYPDALLSHKSAFDYTSGEKGEIFLTSNTNRVVQYPGLTLVFLRGHKPLEDDPAFLSLRASSLPRCLLENLSLSRHGKYRKGVDDGEIEKRLEQILHIKGEAALNRIRDRAREISKILKLNREFSKLDSIIGALLGTRPANNLKTPPAIARSAGLPYDSGCFERLEKVFGGLRNRPFEEMRDDRRAGDHFTNKAFFEAYFSNYIEGTVFEIEEAEKIIFDKHSPLKRPKDAHDIMGTYRMLSDAGEMSKTPETFESFTATLKRRHFIMLEKREEASPGEFKVKPNRAGGTIFPSPEYVAGTLLKGFDFYLDLPEGFARAAYMLFLVSDVHPFADGNGRIARIMMNAELFSRGQSKIIIPTVYREDYLLSLRTMTRRHRPEPFIEMLLRAWRFSNIEYSPYHKALKYIEEHNWFKEPDEARIIA